MWSWQYSGRGLCHGVTWSLLQGYAGVSEDVCMDGAFLDST